MGHAMAGIQYSDAEKAAGFSMASMEDVSAFVSKRPFPEDALRVRPVNVHAEKRPEDWAKWLSHWFVRDPR